MRSRTFTLCLGVVGIALVAISDMAGAQTGEVARALRSPDPTIREDKYAEIEHLRRDVASTVLQITLQRGRLTYGGEQHRAFRLIGEWRIEEAIPQLADNIALVLDPASVPSGIKLAPWALYPAVAALREISGPTVRAAMLQKIQEPGDEALLPLYAFVLAEVEGDEAAQIHLSLAAKKVGDEAAAARCERASQLIAGGIELALPDQAQKEQQ